MLSYNSTYFFILLLKLIIFYVNIKQNLLKNQNKLPKVNEVPSTTTCKS